MYEAKPYFYGTGRRKSSVARVRLYAGTGKITVNGRDIDDYFGLETLKLIVRQPLVLTGTADKYDVVCTRCRRRRYRSGRRYPPRYFPCASSVRRRASRRAQEGRLPHTRPAYEGKKEVRSQRLLAVHRSSQRDNYLSRKTTCLQSICFAASRFFFIFCGCLSN